MEDTNNKTAERAGQGGQGTGRNAQLRTELNRAELAQRIARAVPKDGSVEPLKGLLLARVSAATGPDVGVALPSFCVIAQGTKEMYLGQTCYRFDPYHYLLSTVELPVIIQLTDASPEKPYLGLRLEMDPAQAASVMLEAGLPPERRQSAGVRAIDVSPLDADLLEAAVHLVRLVEAPPAEARVLMPLITRQIIFRLLVGEQAARLRQLALQGGHTDRIARAIERLRHDYDKPLRVETLARELGMNPTSFYEHFKAVTAMSPLQFQKQLRLQEARRLMLGEDLDASSAAFRVGYEDTSHFSREYKRLFGEPPLRDIGRLRQAAGPVSEEGMLTARRP